ncbi:MAG: 16S rRNA (adenine(1518)-N(6)/adenine(1519)-N(6))-dimethyltransferase RsmA [Robiginitomaculum sp.]
MHNLPPLRDVLNRYTLSAKKSFGQHFLLDLNLTDKIARLCAPHPVIAEIGSGPGGLTRSLLMAKTEHVFALEKDARFIPVLEDIAKVSSKRLTILEADALKVDLASLSEQRPMRICANLPYNVGTKLVINWLTASPVFWDKMVLMLQKEVAERIAASPSSKTYGRLTVLAQSISTVRIAFEVPASAFTPPPKVDSAVIVMDILPEEKRFSDLKTLGKITAACFGQRRKMLRKSLQNLAKEYGVDLKVWLESANIDPTIRPETLDITGFHKLTSVFTALRSDL